VAPAILEYQLLGTISTRQGNRHPVAAPHSVYPCAEPDSWCAISVLDDEEWKRLVAAMGRPDWARSPRFATQLGRKENELELDALLSQWTRTKDAARLMERVQEAGVHAAKVINVAELYDDPQLAHRKFWGEVGTPHTEPCAAPLLNEHTDMVLEKLLGLTPDQIDQLIAQGAVERASRIATETG